MSWLKDLIESSFRLGGKKAYSKTYEKTIIVKATVPANAPANSFTPLSFIIDPATGGVSSYKIPAGETWVIDDIYVDSSQSINGYVKLRRNFREEALPLSPPINSLVVSNPSRPRISPITFNSFEDIDGFFINATAGGASATTIEFKMHVTIYA